MEEAAQDNQVRQLSLKDNIVMPAAIVPSFRTRLAIQNGAERNLLIRTWGGLGDQICAEPTLRHALREFKNCDISLGSELPELFRHLKFKRVFDLKDKESLPNYERYFVFDTIVNSDHIVWEFFSHCLTNCVDFPSMCAFRAQLPVEDREILLSPDCLGMETYIGNTVYDENSVFVHAGKHWPSKTFPKDWWDSVLKELVSAGLKPVLIGANTDDNRGTVDVDTTGCLDLRNKTSINDCVWLLQRAKVLITNDSSPLHMAASRDPNDLSTGKTWIGYIASCKHPDYITHWRRPVTGADDYPVLHTRLRWNWREENLGKGGMWEHLDHLPNKDKEVSVEFVDDALLRSWLPSPEEVLAWVQDKLER